MRLSIRELDGGEGFEFTFEGRSASEWLLSRDRGLISGLIATLTRPTRTRQDHEALAAEMSRLIPLDIHRALQALPELTVLELDTTSPWPWEQADVLQRLCCARVVPTPGALPREGGQCLAAATDKAALEGTFAVAEMTDVVQAFQGGKFGLLHLDKPPRLGPLPDSSAALSAPSFVFLTTPGGAEDLAARGVRCIATLAWEGHPEVLPAAIRAFYTKLLTGTIVDAVAAFRQAAAHPEDPYVTSASLVLHGEPRIAGRQLVPLEVRAALAQTTVGSFEKATLLLQVTEGPDDGREIPLFARALASGRPVTLGRAGPRRCDIELDDPDLDNQVLRLEMVEGRFHLVNLTGNAARVLVNGVPVVSGVDLKVGDRIHLGTSELTLESPGEKPAETPVTQDVAGRYLLEVLAGVDQDLQKRFALEEPVSMLGRLDECAVRLHDPGVSRRHATIMQRGKGFFLSPLGDARVILNGVPLEGEAELVHEDRVELSSKTLLRFLDRTKGG